MISLGAMKSMRFVRKGAIALSFAAVIMLTLALTLAACGPRPTTGEPASTPASTAEPTAAPTTPGATAAPTTPGATAAASTEAPQDDTPRERKKGVLRRLFSDPSDSGPPPDDGRHVGDHNHRDLRRSSNYQPKLGGGAGPGRTMGRERRRSSLHLPY